MYRENVDEGNIKTFDIWMNNLPATGTGTECRISPIRCLPLVKAKIVRPALEINGRRVVFPVEMESGSYLEFNSPTDCKLYGPEGKLIREVVPEGEELVLKSGLTQHRQLNECRFSCDGPTDVRPRVRVTVFCEGEEIRSR